MKKGKCYCMCVFGGGRWVCGKEELPCFQQRKWHFITGLGDGRTHGQSCSFHSASDSVGIHGDNNFYISDKLVSKLLPLKALPFLRLSQFYKKHFDGRGSLCTSSGREGACIAPSPAMELH